MKPSKRSLLWWLGGLALAGAVGAWLVSATEWATRNVWEAPRGEAAEDPHFLLKQLAQRLGAQVQARHRFDELPPEGGTLLLESAYWHFLPEREQALRAWVERGGQLVVFRHVADDAALSDWVPVKFRAEPKPAAKPAQPAPPEPDEDDDEEDDDDAPAAAAPASAPASAAGAIPPAGSPRRRCAPMEEPVGRPGWFGAPRRFHLCARGDALLQSTLTPLWSVVDDLGVRVLRLPVGRGSVTLSGQWQAPNYATLLDDDQALLFAAMVQLRPGMPLWIVDDEQRPGLLAQLWTTAPAAAVLAGIALALLLWRWSVRTAPLRAPDILARRSMTEQVRGTAAFLLRHGPAALHRAQWRALDEAALAHVRGWRRVKPEKRAALLAHLAGLPPAELDKACEAGAAQESAAMGRALALMEAARRRIAAIGTERPPSPPSESNSTGSQR